MHDKINIIIWSFSAILLVFFIGLNIHNCNVLKDYQILLDDNKEIKFYTKNDKKAEKLKRKLEHRNYDSEIEMIDICSKILKDYNISTYFIHAGDFIKTGNYYQDGEYQVAVTFKNGELFQVLSVENQIVYSKNVSFQNTFDRIIIIGEQLKNISDWSQELSNLSIAEGKEFAQKKNLSVYWLQDTEEVAHVLTTK